MSLSSRWVVFLLVSWAANARAADDANLKPLDGPPVLSIPETSVPIEAPTLVNDHELHFPAAPVSRLKRPAADYVPQQTLPESWTGLPTVSSFSMAEPPKRPSAIVLGGLQVDMLTPEEPTGDLWTDFQVSFERESHIGLWKVQRDFHNLYNWDNAIALGLLIGITAPIANTNLDREFHDTYRSNVGRDDLEGVHGVGYWFGQHKYIVPVLVGSWAGGKYFEDTHAGSTISLWGGRSCRAMMVGSPIIGVLQYGLGPSRPHEGESRWAPFNDNNGASGHAFIGAIPFLTAARMTENKWLRAGLFAGSFLTAWSRLQDDGHYASQIILGWGVAFLAVDAVNITECEYRRVAVRAIDASHGTGIGLQYKF